MASPAPPPWNVIALKDFAPTANVVAETGDVFFSTLGVFPWFPITIVAPSAGTYDVTLQGKPGSYYFYPSKTSICTQPNIANPSSTNSFFVCTSPSGGCKVNQFAQRNAYTDVTTQFVLQAGVNTLWLRARELCTLATQLTVA